MNTIFSRLAVGLCLNALALLPAAAPIQAAPQTAFTLVSSHAETLTPAMLTVTLKHSAGSHVSASGTSLMLTSKSAVLVAVTGPDTDMLSYRLAGLRNPTLVLQRGEAFTLLLANTDDDMFHDIRFGPAQKRYPNDMAAALKLSAGTPPLAHRSESVIHAERLVLRAPTAAGIYAYFCTVHGHAQGGMVGQVTVK